MSPLHVVVAQFKRCFGGAPRWSIRAPGRVNLIGEHTDYNDGLVLPFAIDRSIVIAAGPGPPGRVEAYSVARRAGVTFPVGAAHPARDEVWQNYLRGVACALDRANISYGGARLCIGGDLPAGAGLSSSAALCIASALALTALAGMELRPMELALLAQGAEHEFTDTPCGIMDPYVIVFGRAGHAMLIDCRAQMHGYVPLHLGGRRLALLDSGVRHALYDGAYRQRVDECRRAAASLAALEPSVRSLRDVSEEMLWAHRGRLPDLELRRARHVVSENARVLRTASALRAGRMNVAGACLGESHRSLRENYEVSCPEIEAVIAMLADHPDVLGARMIGGGFGGMVLAMTHGDLIEDLKRRLNRMAMPDRTGSPRVIGVAASAGAECMAL